MRDDNLDQIQGDLDMQTIMMMQREAREAEERRNAARFVEFDNQVPQYRGRLSRFGTPMPPERTITPIGVVVWVMIAVAGYWFLIRPWLN